MKLESGLIAKGAGGFYSVWLEDGNNGKVLVCRPRGRFKIESQTLLSGDRVLVSRVSDDEGIIEEVLERTTELVRPSIANVDHALIVHALTAPPLNVQLLDRMLVLALHAGLDVTLVFSKADLAEDVAKERWVSLYEQAGITTVCTSTVTGAGVETVGERLRDRLSTIIGPSGAGKSALLNAIQPSFDLQIGEVSKRQGRGRHTTRQVELLRFDCGGWVADTPGFSSLHLTHIDRHDLGIGFPEINALADACYFRGCLHKDEPNCAVREALESGAVDEGRYENYAVFLAEIEAYEERKYS